MFYERQLFNSSQSLFFMLTVGRNLMEPFLYFFVLCQTRYFIVKFFLDLFHFVTEINQFLYHPNQVAPIAGLLPSDLISTFIQSIRAAS